MGGLLSCCDLFRNDLFTNQMPEESSCSCSSDGDDDLFTKLMPEDVVIYILGKLSVTDLSRVMCVSKLFRSLISQSFINHRRPTYHLLLQKYEKHYRFLSSCCHKKDSSTYCSCTYNEEESVEVPFQSDQDFTTGELKLVSSAADSGVVCFYHPKKIVLTQGSGTLFICNPFFGVLRPLPPSPEPLKRIGWVPLHTAFAFGFDRLNLDFKVVKIVYHVNRGSTFLAEVFVYTHNTKSWWTIENAEVPCIPDMSTFLECCNGVSLNGLVYWAAYKKLDDLYHCRHQDSIMVFDLADQLFEVINVPEHVFIRTKNLILSKWPLDGKSLAVFAREEEVPPNTWSMFVVNVDESIVRWEKKFSVVLSWVRPKRMVNAQQLIVEALGPRRYGELFVIDVEKQHEVNKDNLGECRSLPFREVIDYTPNSGLVESYCSFERLLEMEQTCSILN